MWGLKSLAKSTLGELKESLLVADDSDEEDEDGKSSPQKSELPNDLYRSDEVDNLALPPSFALSSQAPSTLTPSTPPPSRSAPSSQSPSVLASDVLAPSTASPSAPAPSSLAPSSLAPSRAVDQIAGADVLDTGPSVSVDDVAVTASAEVAPVSTSAAVTPPLPTGPTVAAEVPLVESLWQILKPDADEPADEPLDSGSRSSDVDLVAALQGQAVVSPQRLSADAMEARRQHAAVIAVPGLADVLRKSAASGDNNSIWSSADEPSVPRIAVQSVAALRALAPKILSEDGDSDKQRLLTSFSERYDALLAQYNTLQQRCREITQQQSSDDNLEQQIETWRSAHRVAQERVEKLTLENADLKERYRALERRGMDPAEKKQLLLKLQQREAEVRSAGESLRQLQEVIEDGNGAVDHRCRQLERELTDARQARAEAEAALAAQSARLQEALQKAAAAAAEREDIAARCRGIEKDTQETTSALDQLLREKEKFLEESEHLIDRRLVTCMLANYLDHLGSGNGTLADAALNQTMQVLGGVPDVEERQRLRSAMEAKQALGNSFVAFLEEETSESLEDPGRDPAVVAPAAPVTS